MPLQRRRSLDSNRPSLGTPRQRTDSGQPLSPHPSRPNSPTRTDPPHPTPRVHYYNLKHHEFDAPLRGRTTDDDALNRSAHPPPPSAQASSMRRSESGDHRRPQPIQTDSTFPTLQPKGKKRNIFRFGKKKSRTDLYGSLSGGSSVSGGSSPALASASAAAASAASASAANTTTAPINNGSYISLSGRKKSKDYHDTKGTSLHPLEMTPGDESYRIRCRTPSYYTTGTSSERKVSTGSGSSSKKKDRKRSEGSAFFAMDRNDGTGQDGKRIEYSTLTGLQDIVNPNYSMHPLQTMDPTLAVESWAPPDSWAVQPPEHTAFLSAVSTGEEEPIEFDEYSIVDQVNWDVPTKNSCIRIFRPDDTFATLQVPLNTTTGELVHRLAGKFFLHDLKKYSLMLRQHKTERALQAHERPLQIQKMLLEQMGYTEQDKLEDVGREDNSYLFRYTFGPNLTQTIQDSQVNYSQQVNLQARNLSTVPLFLYKQIIPITSLDLSKNLQIEVPVEFSKMCIHLKQLSLANNEYGIIPNSIRALQTLEHLNISGNRLRELHHAHLEELPKLSTLRAINNRLETLPPTFSSLKRLTILFISNNAFTFFPDIICEMNSLAYLDISFNKIPCFPDEIGNLTNLVGLFAIGNRLSGSLPPTFAKLEKLVEVDIRQNMITDLESLSQLPKLEVLLVDYNAVSVLNYSFEKLKQLKLSKNPLTEFNLNSRRYSEKGPSSISIPSINTYSTLSKLTDLNLSGCKLTSLPSDLFLGMPCLERMTLDSNSLSSIPTSIGSLRKLIHLSVQNNSLECIPIEIARLNELKVLDVQKNNLKTLPKEVWLCSSLHTLNCSSNMLENFPEPYNSPSLALHLPHVPQAETSNSMTQVDAQAIGDYAGRGNRPLPSKEYPRRAYSKLEEATLDSPNSALNAPPDFNPPSFFANPRNHPPPLSLSLRRLFLGDNRLTDDVWSPLSLFLELRTLNLSFNDLYEIPAGGLCHQHLYELYLSGNNLASLPADDIEELTYLRVLAVNGNKLQTLPAEIGKLRKLLVLDVGNNVLKYNISNWPYDWNWNWNLSLKYLNLSGNKRLEIKKSLPDVNSPKEKNLTDFSALSRLSMLGLIDITILGVSVPEEFHERRIRTSPSEVNTMAYGIADWLGPSNHLATWDLVMPRFRNNDNECIFGLFDGRKNAKSGCKLTKYLYDNFTFHFINEQFKTRNDDTIISALRRTFLVLEKEIGVIKDYDTGASAVVCYISHTKLYVANVGDCLAVISRHHGQACEITQKHIPLNPSETSRIRAAGGFVSNTGLLNGKLNVSRSFGYYEMIPVVNANPYVSTIELTEDDEFVIMGSRGLWDRMSYQTAVDIARTEKDDLMAAAQKLRDFAITYGADDNLMVMVIGVGDIFDKRDKRLRNMRGGGNTRGTNQDTLGMDENSSMMVGKNKRRVKEEFQGDSMLARLEREVLPPVNQVALVFTDIKSSTLLWETQPEGMRSAIKIHDAVMRRTLRTVGGYEVKTEGDAFMVCFQNITAALLWCFTIQLQLLEVDWPVGILETEEGREIEEDGITIYRGLSVRMGIHWGTPVFERNPITNRMDYFGPVVNKASRICNAADGGQICVSSDVLAALRNILGVFNEEPISISDECVPVQESTPAFLDTTTSTGGFSIAKDVQQLKTLGFHVMELGERRLKGLETPEMLSFVYPKQLSGRMEINKNKVLVDPSVSATRNLGDPDLFTTEKDVVLDEKEIPNLLDLFQQPSLARTRANRPLSGRTIDPAFVCALSNLAVRLERLTSRNVLPHTATTGGSSIDTPSGTIEVRNAIKPNMSLTQDILDHHIREDARDDELMLLMENFVTRVENAVSTLHLHKVGRFAKVLEKMGDSMNMDPSHILKALQMFAEMSAHSKTN